MRIRQEQNISGLCHLFNAIPLWGLLFCGWIWFHYREESRTVVRSARMAMTFHGLLLSGLFIWMLLGMIARVLLILSSELGLALGWINNLMISLLLAAHVAICLVGCWRALSGMAFSYPLVGRRKA